MPAMGLTLLLLGVVVNVPLAAVGILLSGVALGAWIHDIRRG